MDENESEEKLQSLKPDELVKAVEPHVRHLEKHGEMRDNDTINDKQLKAAIKEQMTHVSVVLILAGVYSTYSKWINIEIDLAQNGFDNPKPIIAIQPWGAEKTSSVVKSAANRVVGWNTNSIVKAIKELG